MLLTLALPGAALSSIRGIRLLPAKTRVGFVSVHLEASDLTLEGTDLIGRYKIRVPLAPWEDDRGLIRLALEDAPGAIRGDGGTIKGSVTSDLNGKTHALECTLQPDGDVAILVHTDRRELEFLTRYEGLVDEAEVEAR